MKKSPLVFAAAAAMAALTLVGCKNDQKSSDNMNKPQSSTMNTSGHPVNKTCPVSGEPLPANATTVSYQGKTVGFCCDHCPAKWDKMSDAEKQAKLASACK